LLFCKGRCLETEKEEKDGGVLQKMKKLLKKGGISKCAQKEVSPRKRPEKMIQVQRGPKGPKNGQCAVQERVGSGGGARDYNCRARPLIPKLKGKKIAEGKTRVRPRQQKGEQKSWELGQKLDKKRRTVDKIQNDIKFGRGTANNCQKTLGSGKLTRGRTSVV